MSLFAPGFVLSLVLVFDDESDPLKLGEEAFASAGPLLEAVARVANRRVVDLVAIYHVQLHFFVIQVPLVLDYVVADE